MTNSCSDPSSYLIEKDDYILSPEDDGGRGTCALCIAYASLFRGENCIFFQNEDIFNAKLALFVTLFARLSVNSQLGERQSLYGKLVFN